MRFLGIFLLFASASFSLDSDIKVKRHSILIFDLPDDVLGEIAKGINNIEDLVNLSRAYRISNIYSEEIAAHVIRNFLKHNEIVINFAPDFDDQNMNVLNDLARMTSKEKTILRLRIKNANNNLSFFELFLECIGPKIKSLNLRDNYIGHPDLKVLKSSFLKDLSEIDLRNINFINDQKYDQVIIRDCLRDPKNPALEVSLFAISETLCYFLNLKILNLSYGNFGAELIYILNVIKYMNLEEINLEFNNIDAHGIELFIGAGIDGNFKFLKALNLSDNPGLGPDIENMLVKAAGYFPNLQHLDLSLNNFDDVTKENLKEAYKHLKELKL